MIFMYAGYLLCFFVAFAVAAAVDLPSHPYPTAGATFYFLIGPAIIVALTGEVFVVVTKVERETIRHAIASGLVSRGRAFMFGIGIGSSTLIVATAIWFVGTRILPNETWAVIVIGTTVLCTVGLSPWLGAAWLHTRASGDSPTEDVQRKA